jgi:Cu-Zn family superoxide dismutase
MTPTGGITVTMHEISPTGVGSEIGTINVSEAPGGGVRIIPNLEELPPGQHGFHLHVNPSCNPAGKDGKPAAGEAAGPHYDPAKSGKHAGPAGEGHMGDLPVLTVGADGRATQPLLAPRLSLDEIHGHAFVVHQGGDNYSDKPKPLGGGGSRIACGVVE